MNGQTEETSAAITAPPRAAESQQGTDPADLTPIPIAAIGRFSVGLLLATESSSLSPPALNVFCACVWSRRLESVLKKNTDGLFWFFLVFFSIFPRGFVDGPGPSSAGSGGTAFGDAFRMQAGRLGHGRRSAISNPRSDKGPGGPPRVERFAFSLGNTF